MSDIDIVLLLIVGVLFSLNVLQGLSIADLARRVTELEERLIGDRDK
jgi:hypothetical protein